jgi:hypothetical protein
MEETPSKEILEKLKEKGRAWPFLYSHQSWNPKYLIAYSHLWAHINPTNVH